MTQEELKQMLFENPEDVVKLLEKTGVNIESMVKELDMARRIVKLRYSMSDASIRAVEFVFWVSYFSEHEVEDLLIAPQVATGANLEALQTIAGKLHFGDKIDLISKIYIKKGSIKDDFIKILWKINELRNSVAHGRFEELVYKGFLLSDLNGQTRLIIDLMNAALKKPSVPSQVPR